MKRGRASEVLAKSAPFIEQGAEAASVASSETVAGEPDAITQAGG
jgi:hypothetical protein